MNAVLGYMQMISKYATYVKRTVASFFVIINMSSLEKFYSHCRSSLPVSNIHKRYVILTTFKYNIILKLWFQKYIINCFENKKKTPTDIQNIICINLKLVDVVLALFQILNLTYLP